MSSFWNGSGSLVRSNGTDSGSTMWATNKARDNRILATLHDAHDQGLADSIAACIAKNGENAATADLPMGTHHHTGVTDGTALTHYASMKNLQNSTAQWGGTSGGTNTVTITCSPAPTAYAAGQVFSFVPGGTNTGATTLNVNSLGAVAILSTLTADTLRGGEITANSVATVVYNGGSFILINPASTWTTYSPSPTGWASVTSNVCRYILDGKTCTLAFNISGTSNSGTTEIPTPFTSASITGMVWTATGYSAFSGVTLPPYYSIQPGEAKVRCYADGGGTSFPSSGSKTVKGTIVFEVA